MRNPKNISKSQSRKGIPSKAEGQDGDLILSVNNAGISLYGKITNTWYKFGNAQEASRSGKLTNKKKLLKQDLSVRDINIDKTINIGKTAITTNPTRIYSIANDDTDYLYISSKVFDVDSSSTTSKLYIGDISLQPTWGSTGATIEVPGSSSSSAHHLKILGASSTGGATAGADIYIAAGGSAGGNNGSLYLGHTGSGIRNPYTTNIYGSTITLDCSGDIVLNADGGQVTIKDDTATHFAFDCDNTSFKIHENSNELDIFQIQIAPEGATTISTTDADTTLGHLTLDADGIIKLDSAIPDNGAGIQFLLDGTHVGDITGHHGGTYLTLYENVGASTDDYVTIKCGTNGETTIFTIDDGGEAGHLNFAIDGHINLAGGANFGAVGFTRRVSSFSDDTLSTGGTHDTTIDFRKGNKQYIDVTASMNDMNLIFPAITGNFVLIVRYDGNYDIDSWKVFESDESSADGSSNVMWQGGTEPTPTDSGRDVFSFLWDATEETCYGVASLDFQAGD